MQYNVYACVVCVAQLHYWRADTVHGVYTGSAPQACVAIPWRRYDDPARRAVRVTGASGIIVPSHTEVANATVGQVSICMGTVRHCWAVLDLRRWVYGALPRAQCFGSKQISIFGGSKYGTEHGRPRPKKPKPLRRAPTQLQPPRNPVYRPPINS